MDAEVDLTEALFLGGEAPFDIFAADPIQHGVIVSYDGHSEASLSTFIQRNLSPNSSYILRTGTMGESGGHFGTLFHVQNVGWFMEDSLFGRR